MPLLGYFCDWLALVMLYRSRKDRMPVCRSHHFSMEPDQAPIVVYPRIRRHRAAPEFSHQWLTYCFLTGARGDFILFKKAARYSGMLETRGPWISSSMTFPARNRTFVGNFAQETRRVGGRLIRKRRMTWIAPGSASSAVLLGQGIRRAFGSDVGRFGPV
jgi:hypothetical protein